MPAKDPPSGVEGRVTTLETELSNLNRRIAELERLDVTCPDCEGTRFARTGGDQAPCLTCSGVGTVLTPRGERVARLTQSPREADD